MGGEKLTDETILVTGGGGFLGGAIVRILVADGHRVRSFSRGFYPELDALGVEQFQGDISNPEAVDRAFQGVKVVFHTAAKAGVWGEYDAYFSANVTGTRNVLDACKRHRVDRLIHTSSPSVVFDGADMEGVDESVPYPGEYHAHYPHTKAMAERAVRRAAEAGLKCVLLRPHLIWGPGDNHLVPRILARAGRLARIGENKKVDTIYIDNAAHAHILAARVLAEKPEISGRVYFISQDAPVPLWEMVDAILAAGGKPPVKRKMSRSTARRIAGFLEFVHRTFNIRSEPRLTRFVADELGTAHWFDISAAKRDLGYRPIVSTEEGLARLKAWLNGEGTRS